MYQIDSLSFFIFENQGNLQSKIEQQMELNWT